MTMDEWGLMLASVTSARGTCARRKVGAVALNKDGRVISTGYNGVPRGWPHCTDRPCSGTVFASAEGLEVCEAIHAEVNCVVNCPDPSAIRTMYLTTSPCPSCLKLLLATPCERLVCASLYPSSPMHWWTSAGRTAEIFNETGTLIFAAASNR